MACSGCEKRRREAEGRAKKAAGAPKYVLISSTGTRTTYPTELAARAANARSGNRGVVKEL